MNFSTPLFVNFKVSKVTVNIIGDTFSSDNLTALHPLDYNVGGEAGFGVGNIILHKYPVIYF